MAEVHGSCDERFAAVRDALGASLERGDDLGASVAVALDGEMVVDLWGGWSDPSRQAPWAADTLVNVWSTTKTMTNLCALILADRGELDLHAPVRRYWPEFAAEGKDTIEVRHLLAHTAGLSGWSEPLTVEDLYDWERVTAALAAQEPWWEPGTASGYHAVTQGCLVGEVIRRVTGTSVGRWFAGEVAGPLGADFHIGLDPSDDARVAPVVPPPDLGDQLAALGPDSLTLRTLTNPVLSAQASWAPAWRRAEIPAANGHGNARAVAAVQSVLAGRGEARGVRLLSSAGCEAVFEQQADGVDLVLGVPLTFGIGYGIGGGATLGLDAPHLAYWGGWGGSVVVVDLDRALTVAYMMNRMESGLVGDARGIGLVGAVYAALG